MPEPEYWNVRQVILQRAAVTQKAGTGIYTYPSPWETCVNCPHKDQCRVKVHKKVCSFTISSNAQKRARAKRMQGTEQFTLLARIRNGVETVPSVLRRIYHADRMQVRGLIKTRFYFGCKVAAMNTRKLLTYQKGVGHYAQNPMLTLKV